MGYPKLELTSIMGRPKSISLEERVDSCPEEGINRSCICHSDLAMRC